MFITSALFTSPKKAFNQVSTMSSFSKNSEPILLFIVNYVVMLDPKIVTFVEIGKSATTFRLGQE